MGVDLKKHSETCAFFPARTAEEELISWLIDGGLNGYEIDEFFDVFCRKLALSGVSLARASVALSTLHPQVSAFMYTWRKSDGIVSSTHFLHSQVPAEGFFSSPFFFMMSSQVAFMRRNLTEGGDVLDFPVLVEFKQQGLTDWFSQIFDFGWGFSDHRTKGDAGLITSWASDAKEGFSKQEFAILKRAIPVFALAVKSIASYNSARAVLATYIGRETSEKVLSGRILRGTAEAMSAVLIFADLRGFTRLSDITPRDELMAMLDGYLDRMASPIEKKGGEILKFMGDGMLATFDLANGKTADICETALHSVKEILSEITAFNNERTGSGLAIMELDVALHIGDVLYGNVGSENRLDFTVIGPAVNEVSRMESLCGDLDKFLVISGEFAAAATHCTDELVSVGYHSLRGVSQSKEIFSLA